MLILWNLVVFFASSKHIPRIKGTKIFNTILDKWDCDGTLWDMVLEAEDFIKRNIRYMGLRTDKFQRIDKYEYPIKALKEAIINGLIHRDYQSRADVRVFIFDDRVEIASLFMLRIELEKLYIFTDS